ncbi:hypothetical protein [Variovorax sp. JS1663]|uniref:hypothetical protein n=1 Tax=Variovorax sp. JS1663 TaxID=1851577 RepID=UPI000B3412DC|nr:hypothetical protein [Variovorax sp. JS1663]OUL98766.1 hypothetical protein A8M77_29940 [Variovorax sp. JS1663]
MPDFYSHVSFGPDQQREIDALREIARTYGAVCTLEPDQDGIGVTLTAPDNSLAALALILGRRYYWHLGDGQGSA